MVKLLSVTELGYSSQYASIEGNRYYEYGPHLKGIVYWLRSRSTDGNGTWSVADNGYAAGRTYTSTYCLAPIIRLG